MSSSAQAYRPAPARGTADPSAREPASTLAGLIDVLDRADGSRARSGAAHRARRPAPLRSVPPAPPARGPRGTAAPVPRVVVVPERVRRPLGGLRGVVRRLSMWGAGEQGEYLAWRAAPHVPVARAPGAEPRRRRAALRTFTRRMALWGAGNQGEYLAWGAASSSAPAARSVRDLEPPVVLRELPSTSSIPPESPSPAAALPSAEPAPSRGPGTGTAAAGATARHRQPRAGLRTPWNRPLPVRSAGRVAGAPRAHAPRSPRGSADVRARGDPLPQRVRGSPPRPPPRRTGPANGSFPRPFSARAPSSHSSPPPPAAGDAPGAIHGSRPRTPSSRCPSSTPEPVASFPGDRRTSSRSPTPSFSPADLVGRTSPARTVLLRRTRRPLRSPIRPRPPASPADRSTRTLP